MNAFYICGLEAKYAEEFSRNTRRLSQTGESSEVWPISKTGRRHTWTSSDLCPALWCKAELKTGGDCARGQSYLGQAPLWRVAKLKTGGRVSCMDSLWQEARLKTEDMSHTHFGLLAETFFPSPGARLSLIFRVRFGHSAKQVNLSPAWWTICLFQHFTSGWQITLFWLFGTPACSFIILMMAK